VNKLLIYEAPDGKRITVQTDGAMKPEEARDLARQLDTLAEELDPTPGAQAYVAAAKLHGKEGELEIDDNARVSKGDDDGAYVEAWIWVSDEDAELGERCDECDALIPTSEPSEVNEHHAESCSLHPKNVTVFLNGDNDQPATCPECGARTDYEDAGRNDEGHWLQAHTCAGCGFKFVLEFDR
jgi:hypothetical protein